VSKPRDSRFLDEVMGRSRKWYDPSDAVAYGDLNHTVLDLMTHNPELELFVVKLTGNVRAG
jgi:hypothetical protein